MSAIHRLWVGNSPDEVLRDVVDTDETYRDLPDAPRALVRTVLDTIDNEEVMRDGARRASHGSPCAPPSRWTRVQPGQQITMHLLSPDPRRPVLVPASPIRHLRQTVGYDPAASAW
ncbi:hypothetical protein [Streptomyces sp. NBC_01707]|uniref:hypothetical protein n=1 Tax=Streptomyces sp. NBC_01707 TaxID=2975914 RepID=UPI00352F2F23